MAGPLPMTERAEKLAKVDELLMNERRGNFIHPPSQRNTAEAVRLLRDLVADLIARDT